MWFIPVMAKLNFQQPLYSSLQCHMTWFADLLLKTHFLLLSMFKTVVLLNIFVVKSFGFKKINKYEIITLLISKDALN